MDILSNELFPFTVAAALMIAAGVVQAIGFDLDFNIDADANYFDWLGIGRIPFMMLVMLALGIFAFIGYAVVLLLPGTFSQSLNIGIAAGSSLLGTTALCPVLATIMPRDETTSVRLEDLVPRRAQTSIGTATADRPAQAKVIDDHGKCHIIWIKPMFSIPQIEPDTEVLLVDYDAKVRVFTATTVDSIFRPII